MIVQGGQSLFPWMKNKIDYLLPEFVTDHSFGVMSDGKLLAAWTYHPRGEEHWEITIAADRPKWASREVINYILTYPFKELGARRLTAQCLAKNRRAKRLIEGVGFQKEGRLRSFFNGEDVLIYSMLRGENGRYC